MSDLYFFNDLYCRINFEGTNLDVEHLKEIYKELKNETHSYDMDDNSVDDWYVVSIEMHAFEESVLYFIDKCISNLNRLDTDLSKIGIEKIVSVFSFYHWRSFGFSVLPSTSATLAKYGVEMHIDTYPSLKKRFLQKERETNSKIQK